MQCSGEIGESGVSGAGTGVGPALSGPNTSPGLPSLRPNCQISVLHFPSPSCTLTVFCLLFGFILEI